MKSLIYSEQKDRAVKERNDNKRLSRLHFFRCSSKC